MILISLSALGLGAYLWTQLPALPRRATAEQIAEMFAASNPVEVYGVFQELQKGLGNPARANAEDQRDFMAVAIEVALALGVGALVAAVVMTLRWRKSAV